MNHPIRIGARLLSVQGEKDCDDNDEPRHTGPNSIGVVQTVDHYQSGQGWIYGVAFPNGTFVFIDQTDGAIDDVTKYRLMPASIVNQQAR